MTTIADVERITARNLKKRFFVALSYPIASENEMMKHMEDHFTYMVEQQDKIVLSGPFIMPGVTVGEGLTVLRTETEEEARDLMSNEPLVKLGLRRFEMKCWQVQEGTLTVTLSASESTFKLS